MHLKLNFPFWRRLLRDKAGNTILIGAVAMIPLAAMVGGALDMSITYMARAKLQNACDAAVLAGRQSMEGNLWSDDVETEARRFFDFNFPAGTHDARNLTFSIAQNEDDPAELLGTASVLIPTSLMGMFGFRDMAISVTCDAKRDQGHNDVVLVLDVTGSMNDYASGGGGRKIARLRNGARGLFRALDDDSRSVTRFGIVPYSHTVNVARSLGTQDILVNQYYNERAIECGRRSCYYVYRPKTVHVKYSTWGNRYDTDDENRDAFRTSGDGCIEERPSVGRTMSPFEINATVTRADIDNRAPGDDSDVNLQFGRYDPAVQEGESQDGCPAEASRLQIFADESAFQDAIDDATARVTGGTYHDVGMLWGARFMSRTGFFSADNPTERSGIPVKQHIVFMTDGILDTGDTLYSAHGIERYQSRTQGSGSQTSRHMARFRAACTVAKSMGITIWVIALDVGSTDDIEPCATSAAHFYISDGSDLEEVFESIGQGIGNLRLTR
ncbi:MAG: pilus assembly protein [Novosphingobium sp.]|nr:pilus assembly protein [Novosphingobium sp.]